MDDEEILFVGVDIYKTLKELSDKTLIVPKEWSEEETRAYKLGVENTFSLLKYFLNQAVQDKEPPYSAFYNFLVNIPGLPVVEEFGSIEELVDKYEEILYGN